MSKLCRLPDTSEVEEFVERVDVVTKEVNNILNGNESIEELEKKEKQLKLEMEGKRIIEREKKEQEEKEFLSGKNGMGENNNYSYYCKYCCVTYSYELELCVRCGSKVMSKEERQKDLEEKIKRYKIKKEERDKRRKKWEDLKKKDIEKNSGNIKTTTKRNNLYEYEKWAYFEPDSDSDVERITYPTIGLSDENQLKLSNLEKSLNADIRKKKKSREIALRFKLQGNAYAKKKNFIKAIECYENGINICKDFIELYTNLSLCQIKVYQYKNAIKTCEKAIEYFEAFPNDPHLNHDIIFKAYSRKGLALYHLHKIVDAAECFQQALNFSPKDEGLRRYIKICERLLEDEKAVRFFLENKKREKHNKFDHCPSFISEEANQKWCCRQVKKYMKMEESQFFEMNIQDLVNLERVATMCDNTEVLLCIESDIRLLLSTSPKKGEGRHRFSPVLRAFTKILHSYNDQINNLLKGDILKSEHVEKSNISANMFEYKLKAEHIIETLGLLAQNNPLHMEGLVEVVKPVLTFYALKFINCDVAMFFLGTAVRCGLVAVEIGRLIKKCSSFWNVFFEMVERVFSNYVKVNNKEKAKNLDIADIVLKSGVKRSYYSYFQFLLRICLETDINELLTHTYLEKSLSICHHINKRFKERDDCIFYCTEFLINLYLGGGLLKDEIFGICWDGVFYLLKTEKDSITMSVLMNFVEIMTYMWSEELQKDKPNIPFLQKIEMGVIYNIMKFWNCDDEERNASILKLLSRFLMYNSHLKGMKMIEKISREANSTKYGELKTKTNTNMKGTASTTKGQNSSKRPSNPKRTDTDIFAKDDKTYNEEVICPNENTLNNSLIETETIHLLINIVYEGLECTKPIVIHQECVIILGFLPQYKQFFIRLRQGSTFSLVDFIDRAMNLFNFYESHFKNGKYLALATDLVAFYSGMLKKIDSAVEMKTEVLNKMKPLIIKLLHFTNVTTFKPLRENLIVMFSVILLKNIYSDVIKNYPLRDIILKDNLVGEILKRTKV